MNERETRLRRTVARFMRCCLNRLPRSIVLILLVGLGSSPVSLTAQQTGDIVVRVVGLASNKGEVKLGLYNNEEAFNNGAGYAMRKGTCYPLKEQQCEVTIAEVPYGVYAIMAYHDENQNKKFDWRPIGGERAGASNYTERLWKHPKFAKAKFEHVKQKTIVKVCVY